MSEIDQSRGIDPKAAVRDRARASRIRRGVQDAVDVPIGLVRGLLADATPTTLRRVEDELGPKTAAALAPPQLAEAS